MPNDALCRHCKLRPPARKGHPFCSKACSNSARKLPLAVRFAKYHHPGDPDKCWPWTGGKDRDGYGTISDDNHRQVRAPRVAYELVHGPIPPGMKVLHSCDNPSCTNNVKHLFLGTTAENNKDKARKLRGGYKLKPDDVRQIRALLRSGEKLAKIARRFSVSAEQVGAIRDAKVWRYLTD